MALLAILSWPLAACETAGNLVAFFPGASDPTPNHFIAATSHPHATEAAVKVLAHGGSAVDAAIAAQMVMTLTEPESSGIGGGAFLLTYSPKTGEMIAYDGRETAPASVTPDIFLDKDGKPLSYFGKVLGGRSVGVPGVISMLAMAHEEHGNLPWESLFGYAIDLAEEGFEVSPKLNRWLTRLPSVQKMPDMEAYFTANGVPFPVGTVIKNPTYADTLREIAKGGPDAFYKGPIAKSIMEAAADAPMRQAEITQQDFDAYKPIKRELICGPYRVYTICSMPPPSSGGTTLLQILHFLEPYDLASMEPASLEAVHLVAEASRLAFADRNRYIADPDFAAVPTLGLIDPAYLDERGKLMNAKTAMKDVQPGNPPWEDVAEPRADDQSNEVPSTAHASIIDETGFAVAMTTSIEGPFGSHLMASGFFLNNQLTDFSAIPEVDGEPVANRVEPGKRPRSSMTPTFVFDEEGHLFMVIGSSGGSTIIGTVTKTLIGVIDWNLSMQEAIDLPNFLNRGGATEIEPALEALKPGLEAMGHKVSVRDFMSGVNAVKTSWRGYEGGADKRRIGNADGD